MKSLDVINVVDVESTCWEDNPPHGEMSEIIEIGIAQIHLADLSLGNSRSIFVRPERSKVSGFCTRLTTITQSMVDTGASFKDACHILVKEYKSKEQPWASYGDYDRKQFNRVCTALGAGYPFGDRHLNIKTLVSASMGWGRELGMSEALERMNLPLTGTHHRAGDDAGNIAKILVEMMKRIRR